MPMDYHERVTDTIGDTPLVRLHHVLDDAVGDDGPLVLAKLEYFNPGGSVKDRIGVSMIDAAEREGKLKPGGTIVEGTSGNTGIGLALAALARGYKCVFTTTDKQSDLKMNMLRAFGAEVIVCPTDVAPDDPESYYSVAKRVADETPNSFYVNQYFNQANPEAHYRTTGPEVWRQTDGRVTHFVAGAGTGGTISGTGRYLKEQNPDVQVIAADPEGSILKEVGETGEYHPEHAHGYLVEGIGEDIVPDTVHYKHIDHWVRVGDEESFHMARRLAAEEGIFSGSSAGSAVVGAKRYLEEHPAGAGDVVVIVIPDWGEHYIHRVYDDAWMRERGLLPRGE